MTEISLKPFACPACNDGTLVEVKVKEEVITGASRYPTIITAKCPKGHSLVVFVDANFQVRDVEEAAQASEKKQDAIDKAKGWFDSL
ncbi:MAG: hypothetical protein ACP6KW_12090 [Candidatus Thorarchaeota archaeon]